LLAAWRVPEDRNWEKTSVINIWDVKTGKELASCRRRGAPSRRPSFHLTGGDWPSVLPPWSSSGTSRRLGFWTSSSV
jgi:hypothetical protein